MTKGIILMAATALMPAAAFAQSAFDAYSLSQPDRNGSARFMSMDGVFGALGGDISALSQNPAGIGIYRQNDACITASLDHQSAKAMAQAVSNTTIQTKLQLNSLGGVATFTLNDGACPNINFGISYNKAASFNRRFSGRIPSLSKSLSNYVASMTTQEDATVGDLKTADGYDPYNPDDGGYMPLWSSILGYDSYLISPQDNTQTWIGQWGNGTSGTGSFDMAEKGGIDECNIGLGGNILDKIFWGFDVGVTFINYRLESSWGEQLKNAYVDNRQGVAADWDLHNYCRIHDKGGAIRLGVIYKPVQALRLGFAIKTPTWYILKEEYKGLVNYAYTGENATDSGTALTNNGNTAHNTYRFRSPFTFTASIAGVFSEHFMLSADYEWTSYTSMNFSEYNKEDEYDTDDQGYWQKSLAKQTHSSTDYDNPFGYTNRDIGQYFTSTSTFRIGAEFRVTPRLSIRAGYSYVTSPVRSRVHDNQEVVYTAGTRPQYVADKSTRYITCGLGYRCKMLYMDVAYVHKSRKSVYHAYTPDLSAGIQSPQAAVSVVGGRVVLTPGLRFRL